MFYMYSVCVIIYANKDYYYYYRVSNCIVFKQALMEKKISTNLNLNLCKLPWNIELTFYYLNMVTITVIVIIIYTSK